MAGKPGGGKLGRDLLIHRLARLRWLPLLGVVLAVVLAGCTGQSAPRPSPGPVGCAEPVKHSDEGYSATIDSSGVAGCLGTITFSGPACVGSDSAASPAPGDVELRFDEGSEANPIASFVQTGGTPSTFTVPPDAAVGVHTAHVYCVPHESDLFSIPFAVVGSSIAVSPDTGLTGSAATVTVRGVSCTAATSVDAAPPAMLVVEWDDEKVGQALLATPYTDQQVAVTVPQTATGGKHTVSVRCGWDQPRTRRAQTSFLVQVPHASMSVDKSRPRPLDTVVVTITGLDCSAGGSAATAVVYTGDAPSSGQFAAGGTGPTTVSVRAPGRPGKYQLSVRCTWQSVGNPDLVQLLQVVAVASVTLDQRSGPVGAPLGIHVAGVDCSESALVVNWDTIELGTIDGVTDLGQAYPLAATVPKDTDGQHQVSVRCGDSSAVLATATFVITSKPTLMVDPASGLGGDMLTVGASGFNCANDQGYPPTVAITWDGRTLAPPYLIPGDARPDQHTVAARCDWPTADAPAAAPVEVYVPAIVSIDPARGLDDARIRIAGSGFACSQVVIDVDLSPTNQVAVGRNRSFTATLSLPSGTTTGAHQIGAACNDSAVRPTAQFVVAPRPAPSPTGGPNPTPHRDLTGLLIAVLAVLAVAGLATAAYLVRRGRQSRRARPRPPGTHVALNLGQPQLHVRESRERR